MSKDQARALIVYRENKPHVRRALGAGRVDYIDLAQWSFQDRFFAFLSENGFLGFAQISFPTPRLKEEVPVWFLIACAVQLKLHSESAFSALRHLLRSGAVLSRVRFNVGMHPGAGFNDKNRKPRQTMVDQDTVRKFYRDVPAVRQFRWFNQDVAAWTHKHGGFDKRGRFIIDLSFIPVPDNPNYEHIAWLPLDEHGNFLDLKGLRAEQKNKVRYTPCYALVSLLHVLEGAGGYIYGGAYLLSGNCDPIRTGRRLVRNFVRAVGGGVIKELILDRGFIDGRLITDMKRLYGIDVLIPLKKNMDAFTDALKLIESFGLAWSDYDTVRDTEGNSIEKHQVAGVADVKVWQGCEVPLYVAVMRLRKADATVGHWALASTRSCEQPAELFDAYKERTDIEERHRQLKRCWKLCKFSSTAFNLITTHVYFILVVYTLVQLYLKNARLSELANRTITTLRQEERLGINAVIVYAGRFFATFDLDEYSDILLHLRPEPSERMRKWIRRFRRAPTRPP
jgi:hypothetical protein